MIAHGRMPPDRPQTLAEAIRPRYPWLVLDFDLAECAECLNAWSWLRLPNSGVTLMSCFGDVFFETADGITMLDTIEGRVRTVAESHDHFVQAIQDDDCRDELLSDVWVQAARRRGLTLDHNECFDWAVPPVLGGEISVEAITKIGLRVKLHLAGEVHRQVQHIPPGTPVGRIFVEN